jgi:hypothetical protein
LFTYLTGAISAAVAINGALLVVPGWRRARKQRTHLRECVKMIDEDTGKSHKDAIGGQNLWVLRRRKAK